MDPGKIIRALRAAAVPVLKVEPPENPPENRRWIITFDGRNIPEDRDRMEVHACAAIVTQGLLGRHGLVTTRCIVNSGRVSELA